MSGPVQRAIAKNKYHQSISLIQSKISNRYKFSFSAVTKTDVEKDIKNVHPKKPTTKINIPSRILKESHKVSSIFLKKLLNDAIISGKLPGNLKLADVTPIFKKKNPLDKANYRPASFLPTFSKIFEKFMKKQLNYYIQNHLSPYLYGYQKGYRTQKALHAVIESWKQNLENKCFEEAILIDLSKAFDILNHELLIEKLHVYRFDESSLKLLHS